MTGGSLTGVVINGPTTENGLPPFRWSEQNSTWVVGNPHLGQPDLFNFSWVEYSVPLLTKPSSALPRGAIIGIVVGCLAVAVIFVYFIQRQAASRGDGYYEPVKDAPRV
jgi:hypothetical protein